MNRLLTFVIVAASLAFTSRSEAANFLIDFGNDASFRGLNVSNPDSNGNHWTSVWSGAFYENIVDTTGAATQVDFGFDGSLVGGTDSFNGPAGVTDAGTLQTDAQNAQVDAVALGDLGGSLEAAFDFYVSSRFQIQELDLGQTYDLEFFGSHKYNNDNVTRYSVYSDPGFSDLVATADLEVGVNENHNQDMTATLSGLSPAADGILYVEFVGANGGDGYLNALSITEAIPEPSAAGLCLLAMSFALRRRTS